MMYALLSKRIRLRSCNTLRMARWLKGFVCTAVIMCSAAVCQNLPVPVGDPELLPREARESFVRFDVPLYFVDVKYPELKYPTSDDPIQENVNQVHAGVFNQWVSPHGLISKFTSDMILDESAKGPSSLIGTYDAHIMKNGFISVVSIFAYHRPGIDPEYRLFTVNYCHREQKIYHLFELFR